MAAVVELKSGVTVREVSPEERWQIFDEAARLYLGMSGEDFARSWDAGEFDGNPDERKVMRVALQRSLGCLGSPDVHDFGRCRNSQ